MPYYHGTVQARMRKIREEGLRGSMPTTETKRKPAIFITDHVAQAWTWAEGAAQGYEELYGKETRPVILEIDERGLKGATLVPDKEGWETHDYIVVGKAAIEPRYLKVLHIHSDDAAEREARRLAHEVFDPYAPLEGKTIHVRRHVRGRG